MAAILLSLFIAFAGQSDDALVAAAKRGDAEEVAKALRDGATVDARDNDGRTALMMASAEGDREVVLVLLASGAELNAQADSGRSALVFAEAGGHTNVVDLLLDRGAEWLTEPSKVVAKTKKEASIEHEWTSEPVLLHKPPDPKYPKRARKEMISGEVILRVKVLTDGTTVVLEAIKPLLHCTRTAMENARRWRWKPAQKEGEPIEALGIITVTFDIFSEPKQRW